MALDYASYATIQGLVYIFSEKISFSGKVFWILAVCALLSLGLFWTVGRHVHRMATKSGEIKPIKA
jgi:hypothetical protein